jgi:hypothetical protein
MRARLTCECLQGPCWLHSRAGYHGALSPERRPAKAPAGAVGRSSKPGWAAFGRARQAGPSARTWIRGGISASKRARGAQCCKRAKADRRKKARDKGGRPHAQASLGTRWIPTSSRCRCSWARSNAFSSRTLCSLSTPLSIAPAFISSLALVVCALARPFCARDRRGGVHTSNLMWHARER